MPFSESLKSQIYEYCDNHLADEDWYEGEFEFIEDSSLRERLIEEFKGIRFAYKLYEGLGATDENLIFEVRHQILAYLVCAKDLEREEFYYIDWAWSHIKTKMKKNTYICDHMDSY